MTTKAKKDQTSEKSENTNLPENTRKFRSIGQKRVGMLFSGGPAPGANAVIATATIQFLNDGWEVIGFYKGYENLAKFDREKPRLFKEDEHFVRLNYDHVTKIRQLGGCLLKTARTNPSKIDGKEIKKMEHLADPAYTQDLYRVLDAMEYLGIQALVSIGGDDTLKTAYYLSLLGVPTVHVPKTIDNDYFGIPWTFGYFTAIERARQEIKVYNQEAYTTDCYFVLELMGRKAGWYTLGAGIAGEAVRMIGPEDYENGFDLDKLVDDLLVMIETRRNNGKHYGVITVSEGLADKLPADLKSGSVDEHGNLKLSESKIGEVLGKRLKEGYKKRFGHSLTVKTETIGYTTRCTEPSAFDVLLGSQLGMGAFRFIKNGMQAHMVSVGDNLEIHEVPFVDLIDPKTFKTKLRFVPRDGDFYKLAKSLEYRAVSSEG